MDEEQAVKPPRQLKIKGMEGKAEKIEKPVKEKEKPGNKWVVVGILVASLIVSLIFKLTSGKPLVEREVKQKTETTKPVQESKPVFRLFGPVEYRFTK